MTVDRMLTFCAGFLAAVIVLAVADAIDQEAPPGTAANTLKQGAWALLFVVACVVIVITAAGAIAR